MPRELVCVLLCVARETRIERLAGDERHGDGVGQPLGRLQSPAAADGRNGVLRQGGVADERETRGGGGAALARHVDLPDHRSDERGVADVGPVRQLRDEAAQGAFGVTFELGRVGAVRHRDAQRQAAIGGRHDADVGLEKPESHGDAVVERVAFEVTEPGGSDVRAAPCAQAGELGGA